MKNLMKEKVWLLWKHEAKGDGNRTKVPYSITGYRTGTSNGHKGEWAAYDDAKAAFERRRDVYGGIGFVIPEGYFLLDLDHKDADDALVRQTRETLGTYMETSPSGNGYHLYGRCDLDKIPQETDDNGKRRLDSSYYQKNSALGMEIYIGGLTNRFATFTGNTVDCNRDYQIDDLPAFADAPVLQSGAVTPKDDVITECTEGLVALLDMFMRRQAGQAAIMDDGRNDRYNTTYEQRYTMLTDEDIPAIVAALENQKNGEKFKSLYYEGTIPSGLSHSDADAMLCSLVAFRAGPNPELIDAIFRRSAMYRDKWERKDYSSLTIRGAIKACGGKFHRSLMKMPPFVIPDEKGRNIVYPSLLAEFVRKNLKYISVREAERGKCSRYVYSNGCYRSCSDDMFKGYIKSYIMDYNPMILKMSHVEEAYKQLVTDLDYTEQAALNADEGIINFRNGLLDLSTMRMKPHDPAVYSTIQLPCEWKGAGMPTPEFDSYLDKLTNGDKDTQTILLEFMGAVLSNVPGYKMKKALFLYGSGDTGKSVLKRLTEKLLGEGNFTGIDLAQMEARFGTSATYGKRLAGASDMSFMTVSELKVFKKMTGGDALFAEFKGENSFEYTYRGFLWFCMNQLPLFGGDNGSWVFERIIPVCCRNVIPADKQDKELDDKLYAERDGIIFKAVTAFKEVIRRGYKFTETDSVRDSRKSYQVDNSTSLEFFTTCMMKRTKPIERDDPFTVTSIYKTYSMWYSNVYGKQYCKTKKEFYNEIAASLGMEYEDMVTKKAKGMLLVDYCPDPDAWEEYDLIGVGSDDPRKWFGIGTGSTAA